MADQEANTVEFLGGPWDGQMREVEDLPKRKIPILRTKSGSLEGSTNIFHEIGHYAYNAEKGKMVWSQTRSLPTRPDWIEMDEDETDG